jgi:hypothetical protein
MQSPNVQVVRSSSSSATISDVSSILWDTIYVNEAGTAGTDYPIGTAGTPVSNLPDAFVIATREGITKFNGRGSFVLENSFSGGTAISDNILLSALDLNGQSVTNSDFSDMTLQGACAEPIRVDRCILDNMSDLSGVFSESGLSGNVSISQTEWARFFSCYGLTGDRVVFDMQGSAKAGMVDSSIAIEIINMTDAGSIFIKHGAGDVVIGASNTAGTVQISGEAKLIGSVPAGVTFINDATSRLVWKDDAALRVMGLVQENQSMDQTVYDANSQLTSARIRLYDSAANVGTDVGVIATYTVTSTYSGTELETYKVELL